MVNCARFSPSRRSAFYPGRSHTADVVVVQLPAEGLLLPALRGGINPANVTGTYDVVTGRAN